MTKKKFLLELDKRLYILDESERTDIINEYKDIIDEKIKHGKTEKEAIDEFGNIDSLVEEILKAYKINTKYKSTDEKIKDAANKGEDFIKKSAKKLSDVTNDLIDEIKKSNLEISSENIFEIIIKVLLLLVGLALLRIPFYIVGEFGKAILSNDLFPFMILPYIWSTIVWVLYIVACILVIIVLFRDYFFRIDLVKEEVIEKEINNTKSKKIKEETIVIKDNDSKKKDEHKEHKYVEKTNNFLVIILQIFLIFTFFIPLIAFLSGWSVVLALAIYFLIKGINTIGIIVLILGIFIISGFFIDLISTLFSKRKRVNPTSLVTGFILFIVGMLFTIEMLSGISYVDNLPNSFIKEKNVFTYENIQNLKIDLEHLKYSKISNESLKDGEVIVEIEYYKDYTDIKFTEMREKIAIDVEDYNENPGSIIKSFLKELKTDKIHAYHQLFEAKVNVYANSNTLDKIEIIKE